MSIAYTSHISSGNLDVHTKLQYQTFTPKYLLRWAQDAYNIFVSKNMPFQNSSDLTPPENLTTCKCQVRGRRADLLTLFSGMFVGKKRFSDDHRFFWKFLAFYILHEVINRLGKPEKRKIGIYRPDIMQWRNTFDAGREGFESIWISFVNVAKPDEILYKYKSLIRLTLIFTTSFFTLVKILD